MQSTLSPGPAVIDESELRSSAKSTFLSSGPKTKLPKTLDHPSEVASSNVVQGTIILVWLSLYLLRLSCPNLQKVFSTWNYLG